MVANFYVVDMRRHGMSRRPNFIVANEFELAVDAAHEFFVSHGYEVRDGKPFDPSCGPVEGFLVFHDVKLHNGKVYEFSYAGGEGATCHVAHAPLRWHSIK